MAAPRLLACPICAQPGFPSVDALRSGLACAATRPLACPVCADVLLGLDKFTVHLFAHSLQQQHHQQQQQQQRSQRAEAPPPPPPPPAPARCELCAFSFPDEGLLHLHRHLAHGDGPRLAPAPAASPRSRRKQDTPHPPPPNHLPLLRPQGDSLTQEQLQMLCAQVRSHLQAEQAQLRLAEQLNLHRARQQPSTHSDSQTEEDFLSLSQSQHGDKRKGHFESSREILQQPQLTEQIKQEPVKHLVKNHRNEKQMQLEQRKVNREQLQQKSQFQQVCEERNLKQAQLQQQQQHKHQRLQDLHSHSLEQRECEQPQMHRLHQHQEQGIQKHETLQQRQQNEQQQQRQQQEHQQPQQSLQQQIQLQQHHQQQKQQQQQHQQQKQQQLQQDEEREQQQQKLQQNSEEGREQVEKQQGNDNESEKAAFPCHLCSKIFKMRGSLMVHLRVAHSGINAGKILRSWVESAQQLHQQEPDAKTFPCIACGKTFKKEHQLTQHQKTHEGKQWECDVCSKLFTTKYFLKKHKRLHTGEMPYSCPTCNKTFTFQQSYHKHLLYHSDEKPHVCTECDRAFKELSTLHNHQRIHTGEKPFACETCGKCFRQRVSYLVHRRIHTGAMPYQCTACGKNFRYKVSQRTHKCPAQPPGVVVRQSGELVQRLLQGVQHRLSEPLTADKPSISAPLTAVNDAVNDNLLASKEVAKPFPKPEQSSELDDTITKRNFLSEDHQLPQQNNQFIILLEGNTHNSFPPGLLVVTPPLFMLPPETSAKDSSAPWTSQETLTSSQELLCSNSNVVNNMNNSNSFSDSEKAMNIIQSDSDSFAKKDTKIEPRQREVTDTEVPRVEPDNGDIPNEVWFRMNSEKSVTQLETNRCTTTSNSPELVVQTTDFFTMVMSPPQTTSLPSPSEGLRQLTLSPPDDVNHQDQSGTLFQFFMSSGNAQTNSCTSKVQSSEILSPTTEPRSSLQSLDSNCSSKILHTDIEASSSLSGSSELQTINEESLKQLLYGTSL